MSLNKQLIDDMTTLFENNRTQWINTKIEKPDGNKYKNIVVYSQTDKMGAILTYCFGRDGYGYYFKMKADLDLELWWKPIDLPVEIPLKIDHEYQSLS